MAVKIKDVAEKAGVSVTSVSRVLNGGKYVKEEVKERILKTIDEMGYSPSYFARSLVLQKSDLIGIVVPDITSSFHSTILSSIEKVASKNDYNIIVANIMEDIEKEIKYLNIFRQMRVGGTIVMHEKVNNEIDDMLRKMKVPVIFCSIKDNLSPNFLSITINNSKAAYDATKYLIDLGHKKIGFIGGDLSDILSGQYRYNGYKEAMTESGIQIIEEYVKFGDYKVHSGYEKMKEIILGGNIPTAVFAASDDMAVGALNCIIDAGLKVPDDVSIIGFDGSNIIDLVRPKLTSMQQPIQELGELAVEMLIKQINNPSCVMNEVVLNHKLVKRDSCRKI